MAKRKRSNSYKRSNKKRYRFGYRRKGYRLSTRTIRPIVHNFKRTFNKWTISSTGNAAGGHFFALKDIGATETNYYAELFDMFCLRFVRLRFYCSYNEWNQNQANWIGRFFIVKDFNGLGTAGSADELMQYDNCKIWSLHSLHGKSLCLRPKVQAMNYLSGVSTSYNAKRAPWLNLSDSSDTPHYGVRYYMENSNGANALEVKVYATYYFQCKYQK